MQARHAEQLDALKADYEKQMEELKLKHSKKIEEMTEDHKVRKNIILDIYLQHISKKRV